MNGKVIPWFLAGVVIALSAGVLARTSEAAAGVPRILNYQGRLLDGSGNLLGGSGTQYCFRFALYDDMTVGAPDAKVWPSGSPTSTGIVVRNGVFNVGIGDTSAGGDTLDFNFEDNDAVYLNIEVASKIGATCAPGDGAESYETLAPRQRIVASGYAINAATVGGFAAAQLASGNQIPVLSSGNLILGGVNPQLNATGTNALTLQGGAGTGNIQFFSSANRITPTGTMMLAGELQAANINQYLRTTSTPLFAGLTLSGALLQSGGSVTLASTSISGSLSINTSTLFVDSVNGRVAIGTSTAQSLFTVATSTPILNVGIDGRIGLGTHQPSSTIHVLGTGVFHSTVPSAVLTVNAYAATSSGAFVVDAPNLTNGIAFRIDGNATQTLFSVGRNASGALDFARVAIGGTSTLDQFYVYGRINSSWNAVWYDCLSQGFTGNVTQQTADGSYGPFYFDEDAGASGAMETASVVGRSGVCQLHNPTTPAAGEGEWWGSGGINVTQRSLNPVWESHIQGTSNTDHRIVGGLMNIARNADPGTDPANGLYFRKTFASTTWAAVVRTGGTECMTNTGVATNVMNKLRIEVDDGTPEIRFYSEDAVVASFNSGSGACFPASSTVWGFYVGNEINGSTNRTTQLGYMKVWSDPPPEEPQGDAPLAPSLAAFDPVSGSDIAESYLADDPSRMSPGSLVALDEGGGYKVRLTRGRYDRYLFGVVTTAPYQVLGGENGQVVSIGLTGRVPVRVNLENGPIAVGDWLTASSKEGEAMKSTEGGMVAGRALEAYDGSGDDNLVLMLIGPHERTVSIQGDRAGGGIFAMLSSLGDRVLDAAASVIERLTAKVAAIGELFTGHITVLPEGELEVPSGENQIAGQALIRAGSQDIAIGNSRARANSKIFVTALSPISSPLAVIGKYDGGFKVSLSHPETHDVVFDWLVVGTYDAASVPAPPSQPSRDAPPDTSPIETIPESAPSSAPAIDPVAPVNETNDQPERAIQEEPQHPPVENQED